MTTLKMFAWIFSLGSLAFLWGGSRAHGRHHGLNISTSDDRRITDCGQVRIRYEDEETARAEEKLTAPKSKVSTLRVDGPANGGMRIQAWDGDEFSVTACKAASGWKESEAKQRLGEISVSFSNGELTARGPSDEDTWVVYWIIQAPRNSTFDLSTNNGEISLFEADGHVKARSHNGPISLVKFSGDANLRTTNGPIGLHSAQGEIDARTENGPIDFSGNGGNIRMDTQNGPVEVRLTGNSWAGTGLEANTQNGPVTLMIPDGFSSGVRVEAAGHSPFSCEARGCDSAHGSWRRNHQSVQFGGDTSTVRLSTVNGPVSIEGSGRTD